MSQNIMKMIVDTDKYLHDFTQCTIYDNGSYRKSFKSCHEVPQLESKIEQLFFYKIFTQHKILHIINIRTSSYATQHTCLQVFSCYLKFLSAFFYLTRILLFALLFFSEIYNFSFHGKKCFFRIFFQSINQFFLPEKNAGQVGYYCFVN